MERFPGKKADKLDTLIELTFKEFPYLIADIISLVLGHQQVKIMDGPGDGRRDIHSVYNGESYLIQCKFHEDSSKTVSSRELDEIVIGLAKFDYKNAIFATNAKISPQGKREYLDNYPNLNLDYLEGVNIIENVLGNKILKRIWFDGEKLGNVSTKISFPFIIRTTDKGYNLNPIEIKYEEAFDNVDVLVSNSVVQMEELHPYEPPSGLEYESSYFIKCYQVDITGLVTFNNLMNIENLFLPNVLEKCTPENNSLYSVRLGKPYFSDSRRYLYGELDRFYLPIKPRTYILDSNRLVTEKDWIVETGQDWLAPSFIQMSQLAYYCRYNETYDLAITIEYECNYYGSMGLSIQSHIDSTRMVLEKSIFIVTTNDNIDKVNNLSELYEPQIFDYGPGGKMVFYPHPIPNMFTFEMGEMRNNLYHDEFEKFRSNILKLFASDDKVGSLDWENGLRVMEINGLDPLNKRKTVHNRFVDLLESFNTIPSPIELRNIQKQFRKLWSILKIEDKEDSRIDKLMQSLDLLQDDSLEILEVGYDDDNSLSDFISVTFRINLKDFDTKSTQDYLNEVDEYLKKYLLMINNSVIKIFPTGKSGTKEYYHEELYIKL
jgi:hypothetical protein